MIKNYLAIALRVKVRGKIRSKKIPNSRRGFSFLITILTTPRLINW